jgi:YidC/Oxa1 family membrane protein insertase
MYDRKTWVIIALCAIGLVANVFYTQKNAAYLDEVRKTEKAAEQAAKPAATSSDPAAAPAAGLSVDAPPPPTEESLIVLGNEKIAFTFTNIGGGIKQAEFKDQFAVGSKTEHVIVQGGSGPIGGFAGRDGGDLANITYAYRAGDSVPDKKVVYQATLPSGLVVRKTYSLVEPTEPGGHYLIDFDLQFQNNATASLGLQEWSLFLGQAAPLYQHETPAQTGFFWRSGGKMHFEAVTKFQGGMFSSAKNLLTSPEGDKVEYGGVSNQFFTTVIRAKKPVESQVWSRSSEIQLTPDDKALHSIRAGLTLPKISLEPTKQETLSYRIFIGPKQNQTLQKMDNKESGWADVMQYGMFSVVSRFLNWILNLLHSGINGVAQTWAWGLSIIFLTIIVRAGIWPLHAKSTRTMKRMSKLQPEMAKLKEKYPDDPNKMNTEMMGLYKKYGINPLGGCLPMLIQIPIFLGFFAMLQYAVEFRGQSFLWIPDLSQPDTRFHLFGLPVNFLPILMGITSFAQIAMTPKTGDKAQQRIMLLMPIVFFIFCYNYASALALYWTTQNIFSILQTVIMNKIPEPELKAKPAGPGGNKSWLQRMSERQAELQKARQSGASGNMRDVTPKKPRPPRTGG